MSEEAASAENIVPPPPRYLARQREQALRLVRSNPYSTTAELTQAAHRLGWGWARTSLRDRLIELRDEGQVLRHQGAGAPNPIRESWSTPDGQELLREQAEKRVGDERSAAEVLGQLDARIRVLGEAAELAAEVAKRDAVITSLRSTIAAAEQRADQAGQRETQLRAQRDAYRSQAGDVERLRARVGELELELGIVQGRRTQDQARIEQLERQVAGAQQAAARMGEQLDQARDVALPAAREMAIAAVLGLLTHERERAERTCRVSRSGARVEQALATLRVLRRLRPLVAALGEDEA